MFDGYLWAKTLHIVLITSWFAGLFYLPRIFVNLAQESNEVAHARLIGMAQRLYRFMTILMMPAVALGLILWLYYGVGKGSIWMHSKVLFVLVIIGYHLQCKRLLKQFMEKKNTKSHIWYRWFNEAPVVLMLIVTALVVIKPN